MIDPHQLLTDGLSLDGFESSSMVTVAPDADPASAAINEAYRLSLECMHTAVHHAIRCGALLLAKKKALPHGAFLLWIEKNCIFGYSAAARYMKVASQSSTAVEISSLRHVFPSGRSKAHAHLRDGTTATEVSAESVCPESVIEQAVEVAETREASSTVTDIRVELEHDERAPDGLVAQSREPEAPERVAEGNHPASPVRAVDLARVQAMITDYAERYGWCAVTMDIVPWIEDRP